MGRKRNVTLKKAYRGKRAIIHDGFEPEDRIVMGMWMSHRIRNKMGKNLGKNNGSPHLRG